MAPGGRAGRSQQAPPLSQCSSCPLLSPIRPPQTHTPWWFPLQAGHVAGGPLSDILHPCCRGGGKWMSVPPVLCTGGQWAGLLSDFFLCCAECTCHDVILMSLGIGWPSSQDAQRTANCFALADIKLPPPPRCLSSLPIARCVCV